MWNYKEQNCGKKKTMVCSGKERSEGKKDDTLSLKNGVIQWE